MPDFPVAADMEKYLIMYAKHFHLEARARLNTTVHRANWSEKRKQWELEMSSSSAPPFYEFFDKVVISLGPDQIPNIPNISGIEKFQGNVQHSIGFKRYAQLSSCCFHFPVIHLLIEYLDHSSGLERKFSS
jgi:dimethylaniline monooxygenase (N-oxide forming)